MYLRDLWASLARRWLLVLTCLAATAGATVLVAQRVEPTYESRADVVLVPPRSVEDPTTNRYLSLGGLRQAVDVLTRSLSSDRVLDEIEDVAPHGSYEVAADATTSAPLLVVVAEGSSAAEAQAVLDAVIARVPVTLGELQESIDIKEAHRITPQIVSQDEEPAAVHKSQIRAIGGTLALLLAISTMLVGAVDRRAVAAQQSRAAEQARAREAEEEAARATAPLVRPPKKRPGGQGPPRPAQTRQGQTVKAPTGQAQKRKPRDVRAKVGT